MNWTDLSLKNPFGERWLSVIDSQFPPDFLNEVWAEYQWMDRDGKIIKEKVQISYIVKGKNPNPQWKKVKVNGHRVQLSYPIVLHYPEEERVEFLLPSSFRTKSLLLLSWWFYALQNSPRREIPPYALTPVLVFSDDKESYVIPLLRGREQTIPQFDLKISKIAERRGQSDRQTKDLTPLGAKKKLAEDPDKSGDFMTLEVREERDLLNGGEESAGSVAKLNLSDKDYKRTATLELAPDSQPKRQPTQILSANSTPLVFEDSESESSLSQGSSTQSGLENFKGEGTEGDKTSPNSLKAFSPFSSEEGKGSSPASGNLRVTEAFSPFQEGGPLDAGGGVSEGRAFSKGADADSQTSEERSVDGGGEELFYNPTSPPSNLDLVKVTEDDEVADTQISTSAPLSQLGGEYGSTLQRPSPFSSSAGDDERTAVGRPIGDGLSLDKFVPPRDPPFDTGKWRNRGKKSYYWGDLVNQKAYLGFISDDTPLQLLENSNLNIQFLVQLHRMPSYPLFVFSLLWTDSSGKEIYHISAPIDYEDTEALVFLDLLMEKFELHLSLCNTNYKEFAAIYVQLPLEKNLEYLLAEARRWKSLIAPEKLDFESAVSDFFSPSFDRWGKMSHNFTYDTFSDLKSPAQTKVAVSIVSYWSEKDQFDYLVATKSFPIPYFEEIKKRVIMAALDLGIWMPEKLLEEAVQFGLVQSVQEALKIQLASFAEVNLELNRTNDLEPWDNVENWDKLLEACDKYGVPVDEDIEELAEAASKKYEELSQKSAGEDEDDDDDEVYEIIDEFQDIEPEELLRMLQEPEHRFDVAIALCDTGDPKYADEVAGVFTEIDNREDAILFAEAFAQFGEEAEPLLISWLHLPKKYHREAAMFGLAALGGQNAIEQLIKRLRSGDEWEVAAESLGKIGAEAIPALERELSNRNWLIRLRVLRALAKIDTESAWELIKRHRDDPNAMIRKEVEQLLREREV